MKNDSLSQHSSTERYEAIVQTAESLFAEKGYENVSTEEIARTAGVSKALIYHYFKTKEELLLKVIEQVGESASILLTPIRDTNESSRRKMRAAVKAYLDILCARPALSRMAVLTFFGIPLSERGKNLMFSYLEENQNLFASLVEEGMANGEIEPVDSHLLTDFVVGMTFEALRSTTFQQKPLETGAIADEICRIIFDGVGRAR